MELTILDLNFRPYAVIDTFESFLWVDRYNDVGDFEYRTVFDRSTYDSFVPGYYLTIEQSSKMMIIETRKIEYKGDDGDHLTVTGRSLESILDRRVVWGEKTFKRDTLMHDNIKTLIDESFINPKDEVRRVPNFVFEDSTDESIISIKMEEIDYVGTSILSAVKDLCSRTHIGFSVTLNQQNQFVFKLYKGISHAYDQYANDLVIFSPEFGNLVNSNYIDAEFLKANAILMHGNISGSSKTIIVNVTTDNSGLNRKEKEGNSSNITTTTASGSSISSSKYKKLMLEEGQKQLEHNDLTTGFEGQISGNTFTYNEDFSIGDIVQMEDAYGNFDTARVVEMIISCDQNGLRWYPTLKSAKAERKEKYENGEIE